MRWIALLLTLAVTGLPAAELAEAKVTISYGELQKILADTKKEPPPPPLPATVISAAYTFALAEDHLTGTATYEILSFGEGSHLVPLFGRQAKVESVEPADTVLVTAGENYAVLLQGRGRVRITARLSVTSDESGSPWQAVLPIPSAPLSSLELTGLDPGHLVQVDHALLRSRSEDKITFDLGSIATLRVSRQPKPAEPPAPVAALPQVRVETPAVVRCATSEMKIVRDGSFLNASKWTVRHDSALNWTLTLPEGSQLLSCRIDGQPAAPLQQDDRTLVFPLPAPKARGETAIELTYTGRASAFDPVRGEFVAELPLTALLVESLDWTIRIPRPYETIAVQGNVDFQPAREPGEIRLTRELGRGDAALAHVFYQKPETTK